MNQCRNEAMKQCHFDVCESARMCRCCRCCSLVLWLVLQDSSSSQRDPSCCWCCGVVNISRFCYVRRSIVRTALLNRIILSKNWKFRLLYWTLSRPPDAFRVKASKHLLTAGCLALQEVSILEFMDTVWPALLLMQSIPMGSGDPSQVKSSQVKSSQLVGLPWGPHAISSPPP